MKRSWWFVAVAIAGCHHSPTSAEVASRDRATDAASGAFGDCSQPPRGRPAPPTRPDGASPSITVSDTWETDTGDLLMTSLQPACPDFPGVASCDHGSARGIFRVARGTSAYQSVFVSDQSLNGIWGNGTVVVAVGARVILRSTDAGKTFAITTNNPSEEFYSVTGSGKAFMIIVGLSGIWRSVDEGRTWSKIPAPTDDLLHRVSAHCNDVVATGYDDFAIRSADGGLTWTVVRKKVEEPHHKKKKGP